MIGYLKKLLSAAGEQSGRPPYYSIVCPYCFHKFEPDEVVFRATHIRDDDEEFMERIDEKLSAWRLRFNGGEQYAAAVIDPNTVAEENRFYVQNVLVGVLDKYGQSTRRRLCPECHNELPIDAGRTPSNIISVVGASQVGKSVFIASLVHTLQNSTASNFEAACVPVTPAVSRRFKTQFSDPIFNRGQMIGATDPNEQMEPYIFQFKFKDEQRQPVMLVFFDVAGEGMTKREYLELQAAHIKNSAAILFLVDPLQIRTIREKIRLNQGQEQGEFSDRYDEPVDVLSSLYENFIAHEEGGRTKIPTAVVLTKSDMLHHLKEEDSDYIQPNSNVFRNIVHKQYLDGIEFDNINGEIGRFIGRVDRPFKDAVDVYFQNSAFFAVSSLGSNPVNQQLPGVVTPVRVDEPFIWLLHQLGYIDRRDVH